MPEYRDLLRGFRDETELTPEAARRLRRALQAPEPRPRRAPALVAALAAAGLALGLGFPALREHLAPPRPISGHLATGPLTGEVQLAVDGVGEVSGSSADLELTWRAGRLQLEVEPDQGVNLSVRTDEGVARVVGTGFVVQRDALGTQVSVSHGVVELTCEGASPLRLHAGDSGICLPTSAAGRLGRVRALQDRGEPPERLLGELESAVTLPDAQGDLGQELRSVELETLLRLDRREEALSLAERLSRVEGPRTLDAHRAAARLYLSRPAGPDCAGALPHLRALDRNGRLDADTPWLNLCETEQTP